MKKYSFVFIVTLILVIVGCTSEQGALPAGAVLTDAQLSAIVLDPTDKYTWVSQPSGQNTFVSDAAHGTLQYNLLLNKKANDACTDNGRLPVSATFPDSSLIVKKLMSGGNVDAYYVMYKYKGSWKWAKFNPAGNTIFSINTDPNAACVSCHNFQHRDLVRTFDAH